VITVLAVHFAVAAVAPFFFRKFGRNAFYMPGRGARGAFVWLLFQHAAVYSAVDGAVAEVVPWIPGLA
jgi:multicomponent Na+:H+ antiporter subunit A